MKQRCQNDFYRQPQAFLGDGRTLYLNCQFYNEITADITLVAAELFRDILRKLKEEFPDTDFHDFTSFDKVLGERETLQSVSSLPKLPAAAKSILSSLENMHC